MTRFLCSLLVGLCLLVSGCEIVSGVDQYSVLDGDVPDATVVDAAPPDAGPATPDAAVDGGTMTDAGTPADAD